MARPVLVREAPSSLPEELTEFVGRRDDRAEVRRLLSESRLVTLTGLGGVGKTRLAVRVATEVRSNRHEVRLLRRGHMLCALDGGPDVDAAAMLSTPDSPGSPIRG